MRGLAGFVGPYLKGSVVKDIAILVDFKQGGTLVALACGELLAQVRRVAVHAAGDPGGSRPKGQSKWV